MTESLRVELILQAEKAYLDLLTQVDYLLDATAFYVERYPIASDSDEFIHHEIASTVNLLAASIKILGQSIVDLKLDQPRKIAKANLQLEVMNEVWAGSQALLYFLISNHICVEKYNLEMAADAFKRLCSSNRRLP